jgi:cell shape-determining protein MreD
MPLPYLLFIILYPVNGNRSGLLITSFLLGLTMDVFSNSGTRRCLCDFSLF